MIIIKEKSENSSIREAPSLEDVVGLGGFKGCTIRGPKLSIDNSRALFKGELRDRTYFEFFR